jgi:excisionase family DNA binding protein
MSGSQWDDLTLDDLFAEMERRPGDGVMHMLTADDVALADAPLADLVAEIGRRLAALAAPKGSAGQDGVDDLHLLDAPRVADLLGVPTARVYELARRGEIGCTRDGKTVRFTRAHVGAFISSRSVAAKAG